MDKLTKNIYLTVVLFVVSSSAQMTGRRTTKDKASTGVSVVNHAAPTVIPVVSDTAAVKAMRTVIDHSGGALAWLNLRSASESFSVAEKRTGTSTPQRLLDDWSTDATRYRRSRAQGQGTPTDHSGGLSFTVGSGKQQQTLPEFDQARMLAGRLPGAAAEIMLRRDDYLLKLAAHSACNANELCIDVFRRNVSSHTYDREQQWIIASSGLPRQVRVLLPTVGSRLRETWKVMTILEYEKHGELLIPAKTEVGSSGIDNRVWTLLAFKANPGFNVASFDQEVPQ